MIKMKGKDGKTYKIPKEQVKAFQLNGYILIKADKKAKSKKED